MAASMLLAVDGLIAFSYVPLRIITLLGYKRFLLSMLWRLSFL